LGSVLTIVSKLTPCQAKTARDVVVNATAARMNVSDIKFVPCGDADAVDVDTEAEEGDDQDATKTTTTATAVEARSDGDACNEDCCTCSDESITEVVHRLLLIGPCVAGSIDQVGVAHSIASDVLNLTSVCVWDFFTERWDVQVCASASTSASFFFFFPSNHCHMRACAGVFSRAE
jgi:hypothetical protein